jgi:NAD(P)-dependent dehydrogenase (short-subunit alcohol dehydrogenase family)
MNAIITGGGGEIGGACARLLAKTAANVLIVDADRARAEDVGRQINQDAASAAVAEAIPADVSLSADVRRYVAAAAARGPIDAIVHAAGVAGPAAPMPGLDEAEFD